MWEKKKIDDESRMKKIEDAKRDRLKGIQEYKQAIAEQR